MSFGYTSAQSPLLTTLHGKLIEYEDAVNHAYAVHEKYGFLPGFEMEPPSGDLMDKMRRTSKAFNTVLQHVEDVELHVDSDYVLLHRDVCADANVLFKAPPSEEEAADRARTVRTRSPILQNSSSLELTFRPHASREVLLRSRILANSFELRALASPVER